MASKSEVMFAKQCDEMGIPWDYESEFFMWNPPPPKPKRYTPDFPVPTKAGGIIYLEYKGYLRNAAEKLKMTSMKKQHPELDIRFVFEKANKPMLGAQKRKDGTKQTHAQWAESYGFPWMQFNPRQKKTLKECMPKSWLKEMAI